MSNPYAPPSVNESVTGDFSRFRYVGFLLIAIGLVTLAVGSTRVLPAPIGLVAILSMMITCPGIALVAFSLPGKTESGRRRKIIVWLLIPVFAVLIIGGTLVIHTMRLQRALQQARLEAMRAQEMAQQAAEEASRQFSDSMDSNSEPQAGN